MKSAKTFLFALLTLLPIHAVTASEPDKMNTVAAIEGTWTLAFADVKHPDGTRTHDYGDAPKGRLQIDHAGHYSLFVLDNSRPRFAANDKKAGTPGEFRAATLGASAHFGTVDIDPVKGTLTFRIEGATYPNWEGATQVRSYVLSGDVLSYEVPPRPNGDIPMTGWKKLRVD
ncbi:lipocalin-like domain protein [Rhodanobacter sp. Soil772]|uniref:lipocalin-like domain-containing protein n=1 Tax=Rhodanobacter sp. Soil772 TaxID=1736406 RepID=UPI0006F44BDD|nr:lipocalin-like domain-containing protein [Rhodanobacter sp. Soil772]KRE84688.1 lipocalin-like domain protein [Rhodanobacter sp. Soil772]